jgi:hypothetical protein
MFIQTHWLIGKVVVQLVAREMPDRLDPLGFCWGSILPDLARPYNQVPHNLEDSHPLLKDMLLKSQNSAFSNQKALSVHLGMIGHFLSDYFCSAHNRPDLMSLIPHTIYEAKLLGQVNEPMLRKLAFALPKNEIETSDLYSYLQGKHQDYRQAPPGPETDFSFAMQVVPTMVLSLLSWRTSHEMLQVA